jgi:signal transduction histidine kinase/ActR/RegA family two-component response regulator
MCVLARCAVGEQFVHPALLELTLHMRVKIADPEITGTLTTKTYFLHDVPKTCHFRETTNIARFTTSPYDGEKNYLDEKVPMSIANPTVTPSIQSLLLSHEWSSSSFGERDHWPTQLAYTVDLMTTNEFPMFLIWGSGHHLLYNDAYAVILGAKHPWAFGTPFEEVWSEVWSQVRPMVLGAFRGEPSFYEDLPVTLNRTGEPELTYFTFSYSPVRLASGVIEGALCVCHETTASVVIRERRRTENERLQELFHQAPGFVAVLRGPNHVIEMGNDAYRRLAGEREIIGRTVAEAIPEAEAQGFVALLDDVYSRGVPFVGKSTLYALPATDDTLSSDIYVDFIYQPIKNDRNETTGIVVQGHDVTEQYLARQALLEADRQKDQFIAILAHELRNPLAPIRTAAQLLERAHISPKTLAKPVTIIRRQVEHMVSLLDDLLDVTRITRNQVTLKKEVVQIDTIISMAVETAKPLIDRKNHQLLIRQEGYVELTVDCVRMVQAVSNLVSNAAKYTDDGGTITVESRVKNGECIISVTDTGIGIVPNALHRVFAMFAQEQDIMTRSEGGLGIGLGIVKGLVELHGGTVHAASDGLGKGSVFTIKIPITIIEKSVLVNANPLENEQPRTYLKILLADDNADLVDLFSSFLEASGHTVFSALNGITALRLAETEKPDAAIIDLGMPGMSGYELAAAIRAQPWGQEVVLVAATGWGSPEDKSQTAAAGFNAHLTKPFSIEAIEKVLRMPVTLGDH